MEEEQKRKKRSKKPKRMQEPKKKNIWLGVITSIIIVAVAIYIAMVIHSFFILNTYGAAMQAYAQSNNYLIKREGNGTNSTSYYKDGTTVTYLKQSSNVNRQMIAYQNPITKEKIIRIDSDGNKVAIISKTEDVLVPVGEISNAFGVMNEKDNFILSLMTRVNTEECNGKECYKISLQGMTVWIDKQTYLVVRISNGKVISGDGTEQDLITNYEYEFGTVTDEQVAKPDLAGYKLQEQ